MALNNAATFKIASNSHYCEFEWIIDNFSNMRQNLFSPEFTVADDCPVKWKVILELRNSCQSIRMRIKFCVTENNDRGLKAKFFHKLFRGDELIEMNSFGDMVHFINKTEGIEINKPQYLYNRGWVVDGYYNGVLSDQLRYEGTLTIQNCCQKNDLDVVNGNIFQLQTDFKFLLENKEFCDAALKVGSKVVRAHKCVLCARSPVFRTMFEQALTTRCRNTIYIDNMKKSSLETFLEFLYTGYVEISNFETLAALYSAAEKYEVATLQATCHETFLHYKSQHSVSILNLADMHNDDYLKEMALEYICVNFTEVESTKEWGELIKTNPRLARSTVDRVIESRIE